MFLNHSETSWKLKKDLLSTYGHLFDGTDEAENKKFNPGSDFDFDEAVAKISQYQQIVAEVAALPVSKDFSIVMLDYEDAKRGITGRFRKSQKNFRKL